MAAIKKGDTVLVLTGKDRGKTGVVERVLVGRVVVAGVNVVKKHIKKSKKHPQGGRIEFPAPLDRSNVMLICPSCKKATRVGFRIEKDGSKVRLCKKCGKEILNQKGKGA